MNGDRRFLQSIQNHICALALQKSRRIPVFPPKVDTSAEGGSTDRAGRRDQRHLRYLRQCKKTTYTVLVIEGKLPDYLADVNEQAEEMLFQLVKQMAKDEVVDEAMKRGAINSVMFNA